MMINILTIIIILAIVLTWLIRAGTSSRVLCLEDSSAGFAGKKLLQLRGEKWDGTHFARLIELFYEVSK